MGLSNLLEFTDRGIYVPQGDFYIDPLKKVKHALITHAHSDHARAGHTKYLCTAPTKAVLKFRLGLHTHIDAINFYEKISINGVQISFHPAGHLPGAAQIRIEHRGHVAVVSGDYKLQNDGFAEAFESVSCHEYVTESTFGLPIYQWQNQDQVIDEIISWWEYNQSIKKTSIISAYPLGKSQRLIHALHKHSDKISCHSSIEGTNDALRNIGISIPILDKLDDITKSDAHQYLILTPTIINQGLWMKNLPDHEIAEVSGWMATKQGRKRSTAHQKFTLSDHADWNGLLTAVKTSRAEKIYVTHGFSNDLARYFTQQGLEAISIDKALSGERIEAE